MAYFLGHHSKGKPGTVCKHQAQCSASAEVQDCRARSATAWGAGRVVGYRPAKVRQAAPASQRGQGCEAICVPAQAPSRVARDRVPLHP